MALTDLAQAWKHAKEMEAIARDNRLAIEEQILEKIEAKEEGTVNAETPEGWRIAATFTMRRTVNTDVLMEIAPSIPQSVGEKLISYKPEIVTKELRNVQKNYPEIYQLLTKAITMKPAKPAIKVQSPE